MTGDIQKNCGCMRVGIDVGSTTVKIVVTDISTNNVAYLQRLIYSRFLYRAQTETI